MFNRIIFLLLLANSLLAQSGNWHTYFSIGGIRDGAELEEKLWLATSSSILVVDKNSKKSELLSFQNTPLERGIQDLYQLNEEEVLVLSGRNHISRWKNDQWSEETLIVPNGAYLRQIVGETHNGSFYVRDYYHVYHWDGQQTVSIIPALHNTISWAPQGATSDSKGHLWMWRYDELVAFDQNMEMFVENSFGANFINSLIIDESDNTWVIRDETIDLWLAAESRWEIFDREEFELGPHSRITAARANEAILVDYDKLVKLSYHGGQNMSSELMLSSVSETPLSVNGGYLDKAGNVWFYDGTQRQLVFGQATTGFQAYKDHPWLPASNLMALGLDSQGKVWVGGYGRPVYFMGGYWHQLPMQQPSVDNVLIASKDMVFNAEGNPVVAIGNIFNFGASESELIAWTGNQWDTIHEARFGNDFFVIRELELDQNNNLWVMREFDSFFSIHSQGEWYRFKIEDMPLAAQQFTCLAAGNDSRMWIGTNKGVVSYDGFNYQAYDSTALSMGTSIVSDIAIDAIGQVWVSLSEAGIRRWNGNEWDVVLIGEDVPMGSRLTYIAPDQEGGIWAIVEARGIMHYDGENIRFFDIENAPLYERRFNNLLVDQQNRLWCIANSTVSVFSLEDNAQTERYHLATGQSLAVYPNPGCCYFMTHWESIEPGIYDFRLINNLGQEVRHWSRKVDYVGEQLMSFKEFDLKTGVYVLQLSKDGIQLASQQMIVSK